MQSQVAATAAAPPRRPARRLGWGLHRLGLFAAENPWLALAIAVAISGLAAYGLTLMQTTSHSLNALFQSETTDYRRYEEMRQAFPLNERDIYVVVSSEKPFTPADVGALRELHLELQLLDETESVLSLFSIRGDPTADGHAAPLVPNKLPEGEAFGAIMQRVAEHPFAAGKLISRNPSGGETAVIVAGMSADAVSSPNLVAGLKSVTDAAEKMLRKSSLKFEFLGVPVMQLDIRLASRVDRWTFNVIGFSIGLLICLVLFRNVRLVVMAILCPAANVLWSFGTFGLLGFPISFFMNAIPPLVMVISFAEAMHLTYGIRTRLSEGDTVKAAVIETVRSIGPACVLTTTTTSVAFLSLLITDADVIRDFGISGAISVLLIFVASMLVVPSLAMLLLRGNEGRVGGGIVSWASDVGLDRACDRLAGWVPRRPLLLAALGIAICGICTALYFRLEPNFQLSAQVPFRMQDRITAAGLDAGLAVSSPVYVVIRYPEDEAATSERARRVVGEAHDVLVEQGAVGSVWSLALLDREYSRTGGSNFPAYVSSLPAHLRARLMNESARAVLVTGHFPDIDAATMKGEIGKIEAKLELLRAANTDLSIEITGISAVSAENATRMIADLNQNLALEIFVVMAIIAIAFRSLSVPLIAFLPNVLPIVASGALLYVLGIGLDYAGIIGLTIAFGLAVDDTIHFIHRFEHERIGGRSTREAVVTTIRHIGPVMLITTLVITCGVGVTVFGQMPQTRAFGGIVMVTLLAALVAELFLTPALILAPGAVLRMARRSTQSEKASHAELD
jgi:predicted RND superfamily exporter protein